MRTVAYVACVLMLVMPFVGCGGGLKASSIKPYTDQLAATVPVLIDEALPFVDDPEKRERLEKYGKMAKAALLAIKAVVDASAAIEEKETN